jgi:hypothetical protein
VNVHVYKVRLGLNNKRSILSLPLQSLHLLSLYKFISNPSISKPSVSSPWQYFVVKFMYRCNRTPQLLPVFPFLSSFFIFFFCCSILFIISFIRNTFLLQLKKCGQQPTKKRSFLYTCEDCSFKSSFPRYLFTGIFSGNIHSWLQVARIWYKVFCPSRPAKYLYLLVDSSSSNSIVIASIMRWPPCSSGGLFRPGQSLPWTLLKVS